MEKDKASQNGGALLVVVAMIVGVLMGLLISQTGRRQSQSATPMAQKMDEVLELVDRSYVEPIDMDSLGEHLVATMLSELDPHSTYLSARASERADEIMRGSFEGVGLVLHREGDTTLVGQVVKGGPCDGLGILPGDVIATVDGRSTVGLPADTVVSLLRGPRSTRVEVGVKRKQKELSFSIRRNVVEQNSIHYYGMLDDTTGYVQLGSFTSTSHMEFRDAVRHLKEQGMRHLIFDLRGNNGGSLGSATGIAGELLPERSTIVYTQGAHSPRHNYYARRGGLFTKGRLTVMIDEGSASASEIVSGAVQDNDRGTVVGRRSFGKGLVQTDFALQDGSSVLLTTARYYTPSGRCIQRPYDNGTDEYYRSYMQQLVDETYADSAVATVNDSTPYHTVGGRIVYGGGGITPDVILPYRKDTTFIYYNRLSAAGLINRTAFEYVRNHAEALTARYATVEEFRKGFVVEESLIQRLAEKGVEAGIKRNNRSLQAQKRLISTLLKAFIGQSLFGDEAFYSVYSEVDEDLIKTRTL